MVGGERSRRRGSRWALCAGVCAGALLFVARPSPSPAGLEEMYRQLPAPEERCVDPVLGVWVGHAIYSGQRYRLTLQIDARADDGGLEGEITAEFWSMESDAPEPCAPGDLETHAVMVMPAVGGVQGEEVTFTGTSWRRAARYCGPENPYVPDGFHGRLAGEDRLKARWFGVSRGARSLEELEADPGLFEASPVEFRRISCVLAQPLPPLPPPSEEPRSWESSRCGCF